jgi:hypothetical protein
MNDLWITVAKIKQQQQNLSHKSILNKNKSDFKNTVASHLWISTQNKVYYNQVRFILEIQNYSTIANLSIKFNLLIHVEKGDQLFRLKKYLIKNLTLNF